MDCTRGLKPNEQCCLQSVQETANGMSQLHARIKGCQGDVAEHSSKPSGAMGGLLSLSMLSMLADVSQVGFLSPAQAKHDCTSQELVLEALRALHLCCILVLHAVPFDK